MPQDGPPNKNGWLAAIATGAVAVLAYIGSHALEEISSEAGKWLGLSLLVPIILAFASCWVMGKILDPSIRFLNIAAGIPASQALNFMIPLFVFGSAALPAVGFDIVVIAVAIVWLFARPSTGPLILLLAYEVFGLLMNVYALTGGSFEQNLLKGLITSILIRVFALFVLWDGYQKMKLRAAASQAVTGQNPSN